jgi:hypothetical protein
MGLCESISCLVWRKNCVPAGLWQFQTIPGVETPGYSFVALRRPEDGSLGKSPRNPPAAAAEVVLIKHGGLAGRDATLIFTVAMYSVMIYGLSPQVLGRGLVTRFVVRKVATSRQMGSVGRPCGKAPGAG